MLTKVVVLYLRPPPPAQDARLSGVVNPPAVLAIQMNINIGIIVNTLVVILSKVGVGVGVGVLTGGT